MNETEKDILSLKEKRKNDIIICALKVFCEKGYDGTTVDDITKKAKISHGLFYHYFKSKKDIFLAVLEMRKQKNTEAIEKEIESEKSYIEKLRILLKNMFYDIKNDEIYSYYFYFFISQCFTLKEKCKVPKNENRPVHPIEKLTALFSEGQKSGEITDKYTAKECAENFFSLIQGATLMYTIAPKEIQKNMKLPNIDFILDIYRKGDNK